MQLTTVILSLFAAAASAAPAGKSCPAPTRKFGIMALRSASPIHFAEASATQNGLVLNLPESKLDAKCTDGKARRDAIFYIQDGVLYLYGTKDKVQEFFVDRSGMGQGILKYQDKGAPLGTHFELKGWAVDANDNLTFNGNGLLACPSTTDSSWYVWVDAGVAQPAGQKGCLGFSARTINETAPVQCTYSDYVA